MKDMIQMLIKHAYRAREKAYAPYSKYHVGAALYTEDHKIYCGCNIENASFGATNCAERTAFFNAVSAGERCFSAIAIVGGPAEAGEDTVFSEYAFPCGICRQVIQEFCEPDFIIIVAKSEEDYKVFTLEELLPHGFGGQL